MTDLAKQKEQRIALASQYQQAATNPTASVWVEASAGTGKTKVLSDRVLRLLLNGTNPTRILCLTYTKAAAVEMSNRIANRLSRWAVEPDEKLADDLEKLLGSKINSLSDSKKILYHARQLFALLLDTPGGIKIQTIHSFCQEVLKRFPLEAKISPYFEVMDDRSAKEALESIKTNILQNPSSPEIKQALSLLTSSVSEYQFPEILRDLTEQRNTIETFLAKYKDFNCLIEALAQKLGISTSATIEQLENTFWDELPCENVKILIKALEVGTPTSKNNAVKLDLAVKQKDLPLYQSVLLTKDLSLQSKLLVKGSLQIFPQSLSIAQEEANRLISFINKKTAISLLSHTKAVFTLAKEMLSLYQTYKKQHSKMDYNDLIILTKNLLQTPKISDWILYKLDGGIDSVLIDEAQDTSPEQWAIIKALTEEFFAGQGLQDHQPTVFVVGDRKQSIYSFQGADPEEFEKMHHYFSSKDSNFQTIKMDVSFRSTAAVLDTVNKVFLNPKARSGVADKDQNITHSPARIGDGGRIELWPLVESNLPDEDSENWQPPVEKLETPSSSSKLATQIATMIQNKIKHRELLKSQDRPLKYSDFLILVQRRNAFVEEIVRACKNIGVSITGVDKISLNDQISINDLIAAAKFALLPEDDLNLACLLKSPLFNLNDDDLLTLCYDRKDQSVWQRLQQAPQYKDISATLFSLHQIGQTVRPFEFFSFILNNLCGRKKFISRLGHDCEDALDEFINLSLNFEQEHIPSLQLFVEWMEKDDVEIKRDLEQTDSDAVRLMTVHGSKGLQSPIVILPDTVRIKNQSCKAGLLKGKESLFYPLSKEDYEENAKHIKEEENLLSLEEYHRLLYVALTRAEECLCICGYKGKNKVNPQSWYEICRESFADIATEVSDEKMIYEVPQQLSPKPSKQEQFFESSTPLPSWINQEPKGETPLSKPLTPSHQDENDVSVLSPLQQSNTTKLYQRGRIIHKMLQFLPTAQEQNRADLCQTFLETQAADFSDIEKQKIKNEVLNLIANPKFSPLFSQNSLAEVSIMGKVDDRIISGQIDRLVVTDKKVMIVDYKTNRPAAQTLSDVPLSYLKQMSAYKKVISSIYPTKEVETYILWTNTSQIMKI